MRPQKQDQDKLGQSSEHGRDSAEHRHEAVLKDRQQEAIIFTFRLDTDTNMPNKTTQGSKMPAATPMVLIPWLMLIRHSIMSTNAVAMTGVWIM